MIPRYEDPTIATVCSDQARCDRWAGVELCALATRTGATEEVLDALYERRPNPRGVRQQELETGHEMIAFLLAWKKNIQHYEADSNVLAMAGQLHAQLTSSDVQDTVMALELRDISHRVVSLIAQLLQALAGPSSSEQPQIARTHGQWAVVRTVGHFWEVQRQTLLRIQDRFDEARAGIVRGKMSGPVGTSGLSNEDQARVMSGLRLHAVASTQIVPRDGLSHWAHVMSDLATHCESIATAVWLLAQSEIREVQEGTRVGSSSMPHKRNPVASENIRGLARMARSRAQELQLGMVQFGDHDLAHSSVERVAIPDLAHLVCTALNRTTALMRDLTWDYDRMADRAARSGSDSYDQLNSEVRSGADYLQAHEGISAEHGA